MRLLTRRRINRMLVEYRERRGTLFTVNASPGVPIGAPFEEWCEYQTWVIAWIEYGKATYNQRGE